MDGSRKDTCFIGMIAPALHRLAASRSLTYGEGEFARED